MEASNGLSVKQKRILTVFLLVLTAGFIALICVYVGMPLIRFVSKPQKFRDFVDSRGVLGRLAFIGMIIFQVVIAVLPGEPFEIGGGYAFGFIEGSVLCVIGTLIGSIIIFLLVRSIGVSIVEIFYPVEKIRSLKFLKNTKRLNFLTFLLLFIPGTPKDLISYFIGLTDIDIRFYIFCVAVARVPSIITSAAGGSALGEKKYVFAVIVFSITAVISLIGVGIYNLICRYHNKKNT